MDSSMLRHESSDVESTNSNLNESGYTTSFFKFSSLNGWLRAGLAGIGLSAPAGVESLAESRLPVWNHCGISVESLWN
jgi:hypothetical protein